MLDESSGDRSTPRSNTTAGSLLDMYPTLDLPEQTWTDQRAEYLAVLADRIEDVVALLGG